jgi:hypothetical protein
MDFKPIIKRGFLATAGYFLSPLSWWNDLYVNFPIAYGMAWVVSLIDRQLFAGALVVSYWITNIAGLIMLHKGISPADANTALETKLYRKKFVTDLIISVIYTGVIILLLHIGLLKLPQEYFYHGNR